MRSIKVLLCSLIATLTWSISFAHFIDNEFNDPTAPPDTVYQKWESAGSNAVIDSVFSINVTAIPAHVTYTTSDSLVYHIPSAVPDDDEDDSFTFSNLVIWMRDNIANQGIHAQIYIPHGVYNFNDQIIMDSNISLKGAGSHLTELRFLIRADSTSTNMSETDCRKDAILISGDGVNPPQRKRSISIEDLKITRDNGGLSPEEIKTKVGDHSNNGTPFPSYWGNNITKSMVSTDQIDRRKR